MANEHVNELIAGILNDAVDRMLSQNRLRAILAAYERAKQDPQARIPSYFMAALEAAARE